MVSAASAPTADLTLLSRYVLDVRVGGTDEAPVWRGTDTRLRRPVAVRLLAAADPRTERVRLRAQQAAAFTDRRAVPVLDVGYDEAAGLLAVVSDWVPALGFGDYLAARGRDPLPPAEAAAVAQAVAGCLAAAHAAGLSHGRLHPNSLLVTDSGEIRLRGLGQTDVRPDAGPPEPLPVGVHADVQGIGEILYAGLTGRWPAGPVDNLPAAARLPSGALPWPSRVVADVPPALDDVAARAIDACALPKGRGRLTTAAAVAAALAAATEGTAAPLAVPRPRRRSPVLGRAVGVATAVVAVVALGALGVSLAKGPVTTGSASVDKHSQEEAIGLGLTTPPVPPSTGPLAPTRRGGPIPVVAVRLLDPYATSRHERTATVPLAWDGNPATAWTTLRYRDPTMAGKRGVGLLVDLGAPRPVSSVQLVLVGNNTDLRILAGNDPRRAPRGMTVFARVKGAPTEVTLRSVTPVTARYLAIWLTRLPPSAGAYQGGVAELTVRA